MGVDVFLDGVKLCLECFVFIFYFFLHLLLEITQMFSTSTLILV